MTGVLSVSFLLLFSSFVPSECLIKIDYCIFSCGSYHTVCRRMPCPLSIFCGNSETRAMLPFNDTERTNLILLHNTFRNYIAGGYSEGFLQDKKASDMNILSYDRELEFIAQCWANNCNIRHDTCRISSKFESVGQNIKFIQNLDKSKKYEVILQALSYWHALGNSFSASVLHYYKKDEQLTYQEFTQFAWSKTSYFGCGRSAFNGGILLVCNYAPAGNIRGQPIFKVGKPCSKCGKKRCNSKFKNLCGKTRPFYKDPFIPPFALKSTRTQVKRHLFVLTYLIRLLR